MKFLLIDNSSGGNLKGRFLDLHNTYSVKIKCGELQKAELKGAKR